MWKWMFALALAIGPVTTVLASSTSIHASPAGGVAGETVTLTASFTASCPGAITTHFFTIDGKVYNGKLAQSGQAGNEVLSLTTLTAGTHSFRYDWKIQGTICRGFATMSYAVAAVPSPSPTPSPSPSPTPSPIPTPSAVTLVASKPSETPLLGYLGGALIVVALLSGVVLAVLGRR